MRLPGFQMGTVLRLSLALLSLLGVAAAFFPFRHSQEATTAAAVAPNAFQFTFTAGSRDAAGRFMGGTEMRVLAAHAGKLYAGNGYWQDQPGPEGLHGAEIFVLDRPDGQWRVDYAFEEQMPNGRARNLAVSVLGEVSFATDETGAKLAEPVAMMVATTWDLTGAARVFTRDDATAAWIPATLAFDPPVPGGRHLSQVRSIGAHRDRVTGVDLVFAGQDPRGIFRGAYNPAVPGRIHWSDAVELDISAVSQAAFPGLEGKLRVSSFAECDGLLYAAIGQQIYERVDGVEPKWRLIYSNPRPGRSETGLRGLTAVPGPKGGQMLIAAVEGSEPRIVRIDPKDGSEATELDLDDFLSAQWGMKVGYAIAAYNDMATAHDLQGQNVTLIGLEAFIPPNASLASGHTAVDVGYGRLESAAWYIIRRSTGRYELRRIPARSEDSPPMVATRSILASPFENDNALYFAGYDANKVPAHNTAWIVRSAVSAAIGASP
jgi:hypothetical protein